MNMPCRQHTKYVTLYVTLSVLLAGQLLSFSTLAGLPVKSQNPLALMAGLPELQLLSKKDPTRWSYRTLLTLSNQWFMTGNDSERLWIDTESVTVLNRLSFYQDTMQVYIDLPYIRYGGGFMDEFISNYHRWLDLPNADREKYKQHQNQVIYHGKMEIKQILGRGFGDPALGAGWVYAESAQAIHAFYMHIKFDVVGQKKLLGNDAINTAIYLSHAYTFGRWQGNLQYGLIWQTGHHFMGWPNQPWVATLAMAGSFRLDSHWRIALQYDYHSALYRNTGVVPARESHMGSFGVVFQTQYHQWHWVVQEDLLVGSAADISLQAGYQKWF